MTHNEENEDNQPKRWTSLQTLKEENENSEIVRLTMLLHNVLVRVARLKSDQGDITGKEAYDAVMDDQTEKWFNDFKLQKLREKQQKERAEAIARFKNMSKDEKIQVIESARQSLSPLQQAALSLIKE